MGLTQIFLLAVVLSAALAASRVKRIVGGEYYEPGEYTFSVSLWYMGDNNDFTENTYDRHHTCGGSLIAPNWVLTSADCFMEHITEDAGDLSSWSVVLGMYNQYEEEAYETAMFLEAAEIFFPPQYDPENSHGDLALIKLGSPADLTNPMISTVEINDDMSCPSEGQECTVIGWGQTDDEYYGYGSYFPRAAQVNVQNTEECKNTYEHPWVVNDMGPVLINQENICAGVAEGGKDACHGDAGGPLLCRCGESDDLKVAATVSTGYGCGVRGYPGVYTNVAAFASWIRDTMEKYN